MVCGSSYIMLFIAITLLSRFVRKQVLILLRLIVCWEYECKFNIRISLYAAINISLWCRKSWRQWFEGEFYKTEVRALETKREMKEDKKQNTRSNCKFKTKKKFYWGCCYSDHPSSIFRVCFQCKAFFFLYFSKKSCMSNYSHLNSVFD